MKQKMINTVGIDGLSPAVNYVILNLERSSTDMPVFWKPGEAGYTKNPFEAGIYSAAAVKHCSLGEDDIVIPATNDGLREIGYLQSYDHNQLEKAIKVITV